MSELETITIESGEKPDAAIIWLHGLGANGNDFVPIVEQLSLPDHLAIRFIFPHAPMRPITINQGYSMPGWYDLYSLEKGGKEDKEGILSTTQIIEQLCASQLDLGISSQRIILAGFSQGGAIALHCGLRYKHPLAGIMALSTYLCLPETLPQEKSSYASSTPVFMAHGRQDDVLAYDFATSSKDILVANNITVNWHAYDMAHSVCPEEISDIANWIVSCLQ